LDKSIGKDALKLTIMKIITLSIGMLSTMLLSHFRSLDEYGTYSQIVMVVTLVISVVAIGFPNSINYFLASADSKEEKSVFLSTYFTFNTIVSFIAGIILIIATPVISKYFNNTLISKFTFVLILLPWINIINSSFDNFLIVEKKTNLLMVYRILRGIVTLSLILIAYKFNWNFILYMKCFMVSETLFTIIIYLIVTKQSDTKLIGIDYGLIKKILVFSLPLGLSTIVGTLNIQADKLMVGYFYDTKTLAIYTNAATELPLSIISVSITAVLMPQMVRLLKVNKKNDAINLWKSASYLSYIFMCFFSTSLFVFAPQVMSLLYSDKYLPGVQVFRIYSLLLIFRTTYFGMVLNCLGETKFIFYSSILTLALNIILNFILHYLVGINGFAIASIISIGIAAYLQLKVTSFKLKIPFKKIMPWKKIISITVVNIIFGFIIHFIALKIHLENSFVNIVEAMIVGILWLFLYLLLLNKQISKIWSTLK
jgi:O-antigen/teichoic acid export membrane protein